MELNNDGIMQAVIGLLKLVKTGDMVIMRKTNRPKYIQTIDREYADFHERYPALYGMIIDDPDNFQMNRLIEMLSLKKNVEQDGANYESVSTSLGQKYFDEFVKPVMGSQTLK